MRDPKRIPSILTKLEKIWEKQPDLRFFQLLYQIQEKYSQENNGYGKVDGYTEKAESIAPGFDFYNFEDEMVEDVFDKILEHTKK